MKQVPDPEAPISGYRLDCDAKRVVPVGIPPVLSPFDENALEAALRLRESHGGKIIVVSVGANLSNAVMRKALAAGADELIMLDDPALSADSIDGFGTAVVLREIIERIDEYDLVLTGRQAADTNAGVVGPCLGGLLEIPVVTFARNITVGECVRVERVMPNGHEIVEAALPILITVSAEIGELRSPGLKELKEAKGKPVTKRSLADLGVEPPSRRLVVRELKPPARERVCCFISGATAAEAGDKLATTLRKEGII